MVIGNRGVANLRVFNIYPEQREIDVVCDGDSTKIQLVAELLLQTWVDMLFEKPFWLKLQTKIPCLTYTTEWES